ncbi:hypothetical protein [Streptomyces sp. NPDC006285]|uniref:bestrophin-like domain n=1 Tax=Streptomyces sp. NPDC006285 TaxID=3364742 RepID=UPI0036B8FA99
MLITTILVAAGALLIGVVANRLLHKQLEEADTPALTLSNFLVPLQSLTVFVLAFALVMASTSNGKAEEAVRSEAGLLDHMYEVADFGPTAQRQRLQADVVCYTRAVRSMEWPQLAHGRGSTAPNVWSTDIRGALQAMGTDTPAFGVLLSADKERSKARQTRIAESVPAIPSAVYWLLLAGLAVLVACMALCLPRGRKKVTTLVALTVMTALLTSVLIVIRDVEKPFSGIIQIKPTVLSATEDDITEDFQAAYGRGHLPCDGRGLKVSA